MATRKKKAESLFFRLVLGPDFNPVFREPLSPEDAQRQYRMWVQSWVLTELCQLVPELRDKLNASGYIPHETIDATRQRMP